MISSLAHFFFPIALAIAAMLYAAVGQAGGLGYIAVMGLFGLGPDVIKPTALAFNILIAVIGCVRCYRAGELSWRSCYPIAVLGLPFSILGGTVNLPASIYLPAMGVLLIIAAARIVRSDLSTTKPDQNTPTHPPLLLSLLASAAAGFLCGLTGIAGSILLAPLLLRFGWIDARRTASMSAIFDVINSSAALAGTWGALPGIPAAIPAWLAAVGLGGLLGSSLGIHQLPMGALRYLLAALLTVAGLRMILF